MEHDFSTLTILAEVTMGFVAFTAIVASLRVTLGGKISSFQKLLINFFTVSGLFLISIALLPLVLWGFWQDEPTVAWYTTLYAFITTAIYLVLYVRKRIRIKAPTPFPSLVVMIGYAIWITVLALALTGIFWAPSLAIIAAYCLWGLVSGAVIFVTFLASFVGSEGAKE